MALRTNDGDLHWLIADHNGTAQLSIDAQNGQATQRRFTPFGQERGGRAEWPGQRGFVGGIVDASTGLTQLGARAYDAELGRFVSVDPLLDPGDAQQMHGYAYANNSPITLHDATGLAPPCACDWGKPGRSGNNKRGAPGRSGSSTINWSGSGWSWSSGSSGSSWSSSSWSGSYRSGGSYYGGGSGSGGGSPAPSTPAPPPDPYDNTSYLDPVGDALNQALSQQSVYAEYLGGVQMAWFASRGGSNRGGRGGGWLGRWQREVRDMRSGNHGWGCGGISRPGPNSFLTGTRVVMADGTSVPIEEVEVGDEVVATDPRSGEREPKTVLATIVGAGEKTLVEITVDTATPVEAAELENGEAPDTVGTPGPTVVGESIIATEEHPFWDPEGEAWVEAIDLTSGMWLLSAEEFLLQVVDVRSWTQNATVHNLTVQGIHTYHVTVGERDVLTHNEPPSRCSPSGSGGGAPNWQQRTPSSNYQDDWYPSTFANRDGVEGSVLHHIRRRGKGRSPEEYTQEALALWNNSRANRIPVTLKDGSSGVWVEYHGIRGGGKGYFTPDGRIVTFFD